MTSVTFCWPLLPPLEVKYFVHCPWYIYFTIYTNQTRNPKKQDKKSWRICYDAFSPSLPLTDLSFSQSHIPNEGPICLLYAIVMYLLVLIWLSNPSPTDFCDFDPNFFAEEYSNFFFLPNYEWLILLIQMVLYFVYTMDGYQLYYWGIYDKIYLTKFMYLSCPTVLYLSKYVILID